jgi:hypothetical protein
MGRSHYLSNSKAAGNFALQADAPRRKRVRAEILPHTGS